MSDKTRWERALAEDQKFAIQHKREMDEASDNLRRAERAYDEMQALLWATEKQLAKTIHHGQDQGWLADNWAVIE